MERNWEDWQKQASKRFEVEVGKRSLRAEHQWELLDLATLHFDKPTVLCLSGNGAVANQHACAFAKQAETCLDLLFSRKAGSNVLDQVDIIGVKYAEYRRGAGNLTEQAREQLVQALLALVMDKDGRRLPLETAQKNLSRVTFFTYCAGNRVLQDIIGYLDQAMVKLGYSDDEITVINQATWEVSFAPFSMFNRLPSVRVISTRDLVIGSDLRRFVAAGLLTEQQITDLDGVYLHQDAPGTLYGIANATATNRSVQIISGNLLNAYYDPDETPTWYPNEHAVSFMARDQDWRLRPFVDDLGYAYQSPNADCVSEMMAWALCRGVDHSLRNFRAEQYVPHDDWDDLLTEFKSIINSYDPADLTKHPARKTALCKHKFDATVALKDYLSVKAPSHFPSFEQMVDTLNHAGSWEEVLSYLDQNDFLGVEFVLPEVQVLTPDEKDRILAMVGKERLAAVPQEISTQK